MLWCTKWSFWCALACTGLAMMFASPPAAAQALYPNGEDFDFFVSSSTSSTTTTLAVGVVFLTQALREDARLADAEIYIRQNPVALQHDLTLGTGDTLRDLAGLLGLSEEEAPSFEEVLFARRGALLETLQRGSSAEEARRFLALVLEGMLDDESLREAALGLLG